MYFTLKWSILKKKYRKTPSVIEENSSFQINETTGAISGYNFNLNHPANIIQCEIN